MLIRITVKDNHYSEMLERFADELYFISIYDRGRKCSEAEIRAEMIDSEKFDSLVKKMRDGIILSESDISEFISICKCKFESFISKLKRKGKISEDEAEYLRTYIDISIRPFFVPVKENGEIIYVFPQASGNHHLTF